MSYSFEDRLTPSALATDGRRLQHLFGASDGLLPLWIAEPYVDLAPAVTSVLRDRAEVDWYGYESRPRDLVGAFWDWMQTRHGWSRDDLYSSVSPSVGTSIGALIELFTERGDGVILQAPVFTDFKPLITAAGREVVKNSLVIDDGRYRMDLNHLEARAASRSTKAMILCNPHNPVGRVWTSEDLKRVADICGEHKVFLISDEIHADLTLPHHRFTPLASCVGGSGVRWAATHGPIKTFGLAGVCDTLLITSDEEVRDRYRARSSQLHLTRNNVFGVAAFEAAYRNGGEWLDGLLEMVANNLDVLKKGLPPEISLVDPEATYLAWLDFRQLGLDVPDLVEWLASSARLALSPGHWFGREGAGFARMTIAAPTELIEEAVGRLSASVRGG